jgi:hypothetical protein
VDFLKFRSVIIPYMAARGCKFPTAAGSGNSHPIKFGELVAQHVVIVEWVRKITIITLAKLAQVLNRHRFGTVMLLLFMVTSPGLMMFPGIGVSRRCGPSRLDDSRRHATG